MCTDILEEIVANKRRELEIQKQIVSESAIHAQVEKMMDMGTKVHSMRNSLAQDSYGIIAEFKRKSPSRGWIHEDIRPQDVVPVYSKNGAAALSILTDEKYFGGDADYVSMVRPLVETPILRKEFIIDEYQVFQAKAIGADAILLIAADLTIQACRTLTSLAHELELEVLLEIHSEKELTYTEIDADMIGVNNRNLGTFITNVENSFKISSQLPTDRLWVSESGIGKPETVRMLREMGYRGFLIGETFMKDGNPGKALKEFIAHI